MEDIMTPRSMLFTVSRDEIAKAAYVAEERGFDAIPIVGERDMASVGERDIASYWSRRHGAVRRIAKWQRVDHAAPVEYILSSLVRYGVHFVEYRSHTVGLVDLSDLNKPRARLVFLQPILAVEQNVILAARRLDLTDAQVEAHIGSRAARAARNRLRRARRENLDGPLLEFCLFNDVLRVGSALNLLRADEADIERMNRVRNSVFHGGRQPIHEFEDGRELVWALNACTRMQNSMPELDL